MGIFNADRPLGKMLADAYDLMLLSVLWFVGCLPIVTIVTSTTALLFVCGKKLRGEEIQVGADFYKSYRQNFKMSFPLLLILGIFLVWKFVLSIHRISFITAKNDACLAVYHYPNF